MSNEYSRIRRRMQDNNEHDLYPRDYLPDDCAYCKGRIPVIGDMRFGHGKDEGKVFHRLCTPGGRVMKQWMRDANKWRKIHKDACSSM